MADWILRRHGIAGDAESEAAMADGVEAFRRRVCRRLLAEHAGEIIVNCCPACGRKVPPRKQGLATRPP